MAGRDTLPAAVETPFRVASPTRSAGIGDHDLGVASTDDGLQGRGPSVAPSVGDDDRRAGQLVAHGEVGHLRAFEYSAPALVELAGRPPRDRRFVRIWLQLVGWLGRRVGCRARRLAPRRGKLVFKGLVDQAGATQAETLTAFSLRSRSSRRRIWGSTRKRTAFSGGMRVYYASADTTGYMWTTGTHKASIPNVLHWACRGGVCAPPSNPQQEPTMPRRRSAPRRPAIAHARVSADELAVWQAKAAAAGVSLSELLRQAMARTQPWTVPAREVERERTRQIARIGSNLNQIARWAHTHVDDDLAVVEVLAHLVAIERALTALRVRGAGDAG